MSLTPQQQARISEAEHVLRSQIRSCSPDGEGEMTVATNDYEKVQMEWRLELLRRIHEHLEFASAYIEELQKRLKEQ